MLKYHFVVHKYSNVLLYRKTEKIKAHWFFFLIKTWLNVMPDSFLTTQRSPVCRPKCGYKNTYPACYLPYK